MDDEYDGKYARAPTVEDLVFLCRRLNEEGVSYILRNFNVSEAKASHYEIV